MKYFRENRLLFLFAAIKLFLYIVLQRDDYELHRDEYLYLEMGKHLSWGYFEVPPLIALQGWLIELAGGSKWIVRLFPYVMGAATVFFTGKIAKELGGKIFAQSLACTSIIVLPFTRVNFLFQPNTPEILIFTLIFYCFIRFIHTKNENWFIIIGVLIGLAILNKLTALVFVIAFGAGVFMTSYRIYLMRKKFWIGMLLMLILIFPFVIWQWQHHLPFIDHIKLLNKTQLVHISTFSLVKDQLIMMIATITIWSLGLISLFVSKSYAPYRIIGIITLLGILIITWQHGKYYYILGYFPVLLAFGSVWIENQPLPSGLHWSRYIHFILPIAITLWILPIALPVYSTTKTLQATNRFRFLDIAKGEQNQEYPMPQDYIDMQGWQEMADKVYQVYNALSEEEKSNLSIICGNYGQASAINYYLRNKNLPDAFCINHTFVFWIKPEQLMAKNILLVDDDPDDLATHFASYQLKEAITNPLSREFGTKIILAKGADQFIHHLISKQYLELREKYFD